VEDIFHFAAFTISNLDSVDLNARHGRKVSGEKASELRRLAIKDKQDSDIDTIDAGCSAERAMRRHQPQFINPQSALQPPSAAHCGETSATVPTTHIPAVTKCREIRYSVRAAAGASL